MDRLAHDLRLAVRGLHRSPTFAVTAVAILAIGIGVAGAMYSVVDAVLIRPLPVRDPTHIVVPHARDRDGVDLSLSGQDFDDLRQDTRLMHDVAGVYHAGAFVMPLDFEGRPVVLRVGIVTGNFFEMLGVRPVLGRFLRPEDDATGNLLAAVLSYGAWKRQFGGNPGVLGKHLRSPFDAPPYKYDVRIVGVAPPGLDFPVGVDIWTGTGPHPHQLDAIGRLAPGASAGAARTEFLTIMRRLGQRQAVRMDVATADIRTLPAAIAGDVRPVLVVVGAAVVLLLLISYVNVGNLLLVRGAMRAPELLLRRAIGGTARDMIRLLSLESTAIVVVATAVALGLAKVLRASLLDLAPRELPRTDVIRLAGPPVAAIASAALLAGLLFAGLAWLITTRWASSPRVSAEGRSGTRTRQRRRVGQTLVGAQVALAVVTLAGAGLLVRTLVQLERLKLGYSTNRLSILDLGLPLATKYDTLPTQVPLVEALSARIRAIPGVTGLTPVLAPAFDGPQVWTDPWEAEGETPEPGARAPTTPTEVGGADYFKTFEIPILAGRGFLPTDGEHTPLVVVVSAAVAQRFWPGRDPIGKRIRMGPSDPWHTVVGVAGDTHFRALRTATPTVYVPWSQYYWQGNFALRTSVPLATVLPSLRHAMQAVDPSVTLWQAVPLAESLGEQLAQPRLGALLMSGFGLVALLLTAVGLYGVMASTVRDETHDLGVRMALGATPGQLRRAVLRRALGVVLAGTALGLGGALAVSRVVRSLLFDVSPEDPAALVGACGVLLGVALIAAYLPARYASRIDPARALQAE